MFPANTVLPFYLGDQASVDFVMCGGLEDGCIVLDFFYS